MTIQGEPIDRAIIEADFARHLELFDLSGDLGSDALDIAVEGVIDHFLDQLDPDGNPWDELSDKYREVKERYWPGNQINVREGLMISELGGERDGDRRSATYTAGQSPEGKQEIQWSEEGDPENNRPERRIVGLNAGSIARSDGLFEGHFTKGIGG